MAEAIHFGTDGWRAIIGEGFTDENLIRVVDAAARIFKEDVLAQTAGASSGDVTSDGASEDSSRASLGTLIIGYDCRQNARGYAQLAAEVAAAVGFTVKLSSTFCPTPALCWSVSRDTDAVGGIMLTSSHNPAEYLGVKLRMADGGASQQSFTDRVEAAMVDAPVQPVQLIQERGSYTEVDLMTPYLENLKTYIDAEAVRAAQLRVVVDPLYGAGRGYLAGLLRDLGAEVVEINNVEDPSFDGLHPEPIPPWIDRCIAKVPELGFDAGFITDGDADRIGAVNEHGGFVNPHRILTLLVSHLAEDKGLSGRVVSTVTASSLLARQCRRLGLELVSTPVGFKWIYAEMEAGDVMIGGEESGGIGIASHVMERDGLLMALLLAEMMAHRKMSLGELEEDMFSKIGRMEFARRGITVTDAQMDRLRDELIPEFMPEEVCGKAVLGSDRRDGVKLLLEGDAWVMMRPSGTEPLVRIYAEAATEAEVNELLDFAEAIVTA